jgi:L-fucose isomerase-like protein
MNPLKIREILMAKQMTLGVVVGNRGFFPSHLATSGRLEMIAALEAAGVKPIVLTPEVTAHGAVETYEDAKKCAALFKAHADEIDGIIITLPNFGEERGLADALRLANLRVPVLIQATPDSTSKMSIAFRRDSFCGKMSICNNLKQYGIPYSLTTLHTEAPDSPEFKKDLEWFSAVCRIVKGFKNLRLGAIGARPTAFNTVRYSEKLLEKSGITVETLDLSEVMGRITRMKDSDDAAQEKLAAIKKYIPGPGADEDGQAGSRYRRLDEVQRTHRLRSAMLDFDRGVPRHRALHRDEHDERKPDPLRLRGRRLRHAEHVRAHARQRNALRAARLEQQLRRQPG